MRIGLFILFLLSANFLFGQDSLRSDIPDTTSDRVLKPVEIIQTFPFDDNKFVRISGTPQVMIKQERTDNSSDILFYIIAGFVFIAALMRRFYSVYFNNLFKIFFNTSLRQTQLTDIILQARLTSLMFNFLFVCSAGLYLWLFGVHFKVFRNDNYAMILLCIGLLTAIYIGKYISIKFLGWISGSQEAADRYIFIIFLVNKILGLFLIPLIVFIAFTGFAENVFVISWLLVILLFVIRNVRTYSLLGHRLRISRFHFMLYLSGVEIIPLLIVLHYIFGYVKSAHF